MDRYWLCLDAWGTSENWNLALASAEDFLCKNIILMCVIRMTFCSSNCVIVSHLLTDGDVTQESIELKGGKWELEGCYILGTHFMGAGCNRLLIFRYLRFFIPIFRYLKTLRYPIFDDFKTNIPISTTPIAPPFMLQSTFSPDQFSPLPLTASYSSDIFFHTFWLFQSKTPTFSS